VRIGAAIASSVVRIGAPVTKSDAMIATIRPPQWRPYSFWQTRKIFTKNFYKLSARINGNEKPTSFGLELAREH
jgi:hypothetical protein